MNQGNKQKLAEGKTKIIWADPCSKDEVLIESKDDITAGDGERRNLISSKGALSTTVTCNAFRLLRSKGIPTHFLHRVDSTTFAAQRVQMIPIEIVTRRIATGSYLKRNPEVAEGTRFDSLIIEFFLKDDAHHDPMIFWDQDKSEYQLFDPRKPLSVGPTQVLSELFESPAIFPTDFDDMSFLARICFIAAEEAWEKQGVTLVDLKIECGLGCQPPYRDTIIVADVIDNDSWRIWPSGDKAQMKDKQVYRNLDSITPEALAAVRDNYMWVANATEKFLPA
ncbi:MAG: phosphoribosylaminoimidazole carboxylase / phosphoribosylaminoimidazole-succinocarboxamide synthase [Parcubacteria group bacterium Gr01-1014_20]|nr:MAG: phosphoribosylaminoimidazole carboxylase / phosphoribosylaminoimidazole-succinocarboxamide synthase [Parcubacteria group bacterium Gr01-1014_20]